MKNNTWAVWAPLRLGAVGPGPAGPLDKTALMLKTIMMTFTHTRQNRRWSRLRKLHFTRYYKDTLQRRL